MAESTDRRVRVVWRGPAEQLFDPLALGLNYGERVEVAVVDGEPCPRCRRPMFDYDVGHGETIAACDCAP